MHLEILVEDQSGKKALEILVSKIIGQAYTFKVYAYKGVGRVPKSMRSSVGANKRTLLENLPRLFKGYGKTFAGYPANYQAAVILVCDLDDKCLKTFRQELLGILDRCNPKPESRICIAIEEGEAWFLGDMNAIKKAYIRAKDSVLDSYVNDDICGTWEKLADAVYTGGSRKLVKKGWQAVGVEKSKWAENISPHMDINNNKSPSFCYFRDKLQELVGAN